MKIDFVREPIRRGMSSLDVVVVIFVCLCVTAIGCPLLQVSRIVDRGNPCRNNLRGLATALFNYQVRNGAYPGYMNALKLSDGKLYVDPQTGAATPVSWVVMILPDIDRGPLFDQWTLPTETVRGNNLIQPRIYIDQFLCPSDPVAAKIGTPISFVVNTGLPDAPSAAVDFEHSERSLPRDWAANGMFFDHYTEHPLVRKQAETRGPTVAMRDEDVRDRKDRTILITENLDATNYAFDAATQSADGWRAVEIETGCIWKPGTFETSHGTPQMKPSVASLHPNVNVGFGDGKSFDHTRPSSRHPQSVNVAYVEMNVAPLRETISYFVYAKLMSSDDANITPAGKRRDSASADAIDPQRYLRDYELKDADLEP